MVAWTDNVIKLYSDKLNFHGLSDGSGLGVLVKTSFHEDGKVFCKFNLVMIYQ